MEFVSSEIWKFVQAVATENISAIHELLEKDNLDLEQEFYITEIDSLEEEDSEDESIPYEVNLKLVDSLIIDFLENIQGSSYTPLSLTCWRGNVDLVRLLVESGADVNYIPDDPCISFPIQVASYIANKEIAVYLIAQGADINVTNAYGNSALERAVSNNYTDLALLLLENGADPTIATFDGWMSSWNSIHQAIWNKNETVLDKIIEKGFGLGGYLGDLASCRLNRYIYSSVREWQAKIDKALYAATESSNTEIIEFLLKSGANPNVSMLTNADEVEYDFEAKFKTAIDLAEENEDPLIITLFRED